MNRRALISVPAALVAGVLVASVASPAVADESHIVGSNITWSYVSDAYPSISDAGSSYPNLLGTGVTMMSGWTDDAFDGFLEYIAFEGHYVNFEAAAGGAGWVHGGLSSFHYVGIVDPVEGGDGVEEFPGAEFEATLEIQGNYARWTFTQTAGSPGELLLQGDLGSDGDQTVTVVTANTAIVTSDDYEYDPVIGYWVSGTDAEIIGPDVDDPDLYEVVSFSASSASPMTVVLALQDYAPCAADVARAQMVARVATLGATFGQAIGGALECASVANPSALTRGTAASQSLPVTLDASIGEWYLSDSEYVRGVFVGTPAGLTLAFDPETSRVSVSGTPTAAGTFQVNLVLYMLEVYDYITEEYGNGLPLVATFTIEVGDAQLADSGVSSATPFVAGFAVLLVLAGATVLLARRRQATA